MHSYSLVYANNPPVGVPGKGSGNRRVHGEGRVWKRSRRQNEYEEAGCRREGRVLGKETICGRGVRDGKRRKGGEDEAWWGRGGRIWRQR